MSRSILNVALSLGLLLAAAAASSAQTVPPTDKAYEAKLIAVLRSDSASQKAKVDACRELGVVGTKDAVPALAALLPDEKLSHMARQGLESIPDASVDVALRTALATLTGRPRLGVVASLGVRRDASAVPALAKLLGDEDAAAAEAAARALGIIGTPEAAKAIEAALPGALAARRASFYEGLFRCAEALVAEGRREQAVAIYDALRGNAQLHQVRTGALRGAILARGNDGLALLKQSLASDDYLLFAAAVRTSMEMPGAEVTKALLAVIGKAPVDNQVLVIGMLGRRGDASALPTLLATAKASEKPVRLAAIEALPRIGAPAAVPVLAELMNDADGQVARLAKDGLAAIAGAEADAVATTLLGAEKPEQRLVGLELVGRRRMTGSMPAVIKAAGDADGRVRVGAIRMVGDLGGAADLPAALALLTRAQEQGDVNAAQQAIATLCGKLDKPESSVGRIGALLPEAAPAQQSALLRVLGSIGGSDALKAVRDVIGNQQADGNVRATAIRVMGNWKTAEPADDLLALAKSAARANEKTLCLRSYVVMAARDSISPRQRLSMCREASPLVQRDQEKKLLLAALGAITSPESLELIVPHLENPGTSEEASAAAVAVSERLLQGRNAERSGPAIAAAMKKVIAVSKNAGVAGRAKSVLEKAGK